MIDSPSHFLSWAHPLVRDWFLSQFTSPSEPQVEGWPSILAHKPTLISAPTGSGKTLAAFLVCIDRLVRQAVNGTLQAQTQVLYVSPLKALTNDIQKNLLDPLNAINQLANAKGISIEEIQVSVRTGDTLARDRQLMLKKPPHILVTTPESLYLLLTAEKSRIVLQNVNTIIVDEIHALANSKRGSHLALSIERLEALIKQPLLRIGLSATQKPIELVAKFLTGTHHPFPNIINVGHQRPMELGIEVPNQELSSVASNEMWDELYDRLAILAQQNRSTLIFVNTRRLAERVSHHLRERLGQEQVAAHHGSLSRKLRLSIESKLKQGELKALVATASLELGIDIGTVDLVCQIGSTRSISVALQRIGRAGHWYGAIPKGRLFPTTIGELVECASLVYAIRAGDLDQLVVPDEPLDILAQQIVAACATEDWHEEDLYNLIKNCFPYRHLTKETFITLIDMLAEGIAGSRGRYGVYLFRDRVNQKIKARRGSRLVAITSGGAIPENNLFNVVVEPEEVIIGTLDEDFAVESNRGDIILLGNTSWQIKRIESTQGRVIVEDAHGAPPSVPFWRGEAPARTKELSHWVSYIRKKINTALRSQTEAPLVRSWLKKHCNLNDKGAQQIIDYILQGRGVLGDVPTQETVIAERFFDEAGGMQLIIHSPFGARINKAWGLALRKRFCRSFNFELQAAATDDGINISLAEQHSFPLADVFRFLHSNTVQKVLTQAVLQSPIFTTRWRWDATRALALVRFRNGRKVPPYILRMRSDDLLAAVFPEAAACQDNLGGRDIELPEHPLITETMKDVLTEAMDADGLVEVLKAIEMGKINCIAVDTPVPSVFSHEILNANPYAFLDDAPLEERRARAVEMRRVLPDSFLKEAGRLDPEAIQEVKEQAWPDIRNADELHDVLQTLIALPAEVYLSQQPSWNPFFDTLVTEGRARPATSCGQTFWVAAERAKSFFALYPNATFANPFYSSFENETTEEEAATKIVRGWLQYLGPVQASVLADTLRLSPALVESILLKLEASGYILRGHFCFASHEPIEWCERRLLARVHQRTLQRIREEIEPVSSEDFFNWLLDWQYILPDSQLRGETGLLAVIKQLQGFEIPANAWEKDIFAKRVVDYKKEMLDHLCYTGVIGWGRLSLHPALVPLEIESEDLKPRRIYPTSLVPITFFIREESEWMGAVTYVDKNLQMLSHAAKVIYNFLKENGASFFIDIIYEVGLLRAEVEAGLWELVAAGLITADGFDNLRALIDSKRRARRKPSRTQAAGRWSILKIRKVENQNEQTEAVCRILLKRYGICFRELLVREKIIPSWRELLTAFRRLEDRGEIRGGRFVKGFSGEQFALPYAVDSLRAAKDNPKNKGLLKVSAVDPLNLSGIIIPGERIAAISGKNFDLHNGSI